MRAPLDRAITLAGWAAMAFLVFPVLFTTVVSFGAGELIEFPPSGWSLRWYAHIGEIHRVGAAVLYSLLIALCAGVMATLLAIGIALCLVRLPVPGKALIGAFVTSPVAVPIVALGIALIQFFIAYSLAISPALSSRGTYAVIPAATHAPLRQKMVLLKRAGPDAERFYRYLQTPAARDILKRFGFEVPQ